MPKSDTSTLYDEIVAEQSGSKAKCNVSLVLSKLNEADRTALETAMSDVSIYGSTICNILKKRELEVSIESMRRHRRGACRCGGAA